jgi:uncharacterized protein YwqG
VLEEHYFTKGRVIVRGRMREQHATSLEVLSKHRPYLDALRKPAVRIVPATTSGFSKIGGLPMLPAGFEWPTWKGKPQSFLCQIDLAAIPHEAGTEMLPRQGFLFFFYDAEQGTWGFDPKDRGSWRVMYAETLKGASKAPAPAGLPKEGLFAEVPVGFVEALTYPDWQDARVAALGLNDAQSDAFLELCSLVFEGEPAHQLLGYPSPVQNNDMDLECQLVTHGLYLGDVSGYKSPERAALEEGKTDWLLLLQLDSDDDAKMMWGDVGMLYFWIRKQDLERRDFSNVWMILQCS